MTHREMSLEETDSPFPHSQDLPESLHLGVHRPCENSPTHAGMSLALPLCRSCLDNHIFEITWVQLHSIMCAKKNSFLVFSTIKEMRNPKKKKKIELEAVCEGV